MRCAGDRRDHVNVMADPKTASRSAADPGRLGRLRARPMLVAAVVYAALSLLMVAPALLPGRTLSASDYLWNNPPWQATRPASVVGIGANFELADQPLVFQPFLRYTRDVLPRHPALEPAHLGGPALPGQQPVGGLLAVQRPGLRAAVLELARRDRGHQAVRGRARRVRPGAPSRDALRRRSAHRARVRLRHVLHPAARVAADRRSGPCCPGCWSLVDLVVRRPGPLPGGRAGRPGRADATSAGTRRRPST